MSQAPAVVCTVRRSWFAGWLMLTLWLCGAVLALRAMADAGFGWRAWLLAATLLATGMFAALHWRRAPQGLLRWDGSSWLWRASASDPEHAGMPTLRLDLQHILLLHWRSEESGASGWFWLDAGSTDHARDWHALRCALHLRPPLLEMPVAPVHDGRVSAAPGNPT